MLSTPFKNEMKKLYKSKTNRVFGGIIGGMGNYFSIDPVLLRLLAVLIFIVTGFLPIALIYLLALFIVPEEHDPNIHDV